LFAAFRIGGVVTIIILRTKSSLFLANAFLL